MYYSGNNIVTHTHKINISVFPVTKTGHCHHHFSHLPDSPSLLVSPPSPPSPPAITYHVPQPVIGYLRLAPVSVATAGSP